VTGPGPRLADMDLATFRVELRRWMNEHAGELGRFRQLPNDLDDQFALLGDLQRFLFDAGWLRWGWPEESGGLGGSSLLRGVLSEELAAAGCPPPFSFGMMEVLAPAVVRFAPQVAAWALPALLRGEEAWCQGFSEPEAGSDLASLRLRASDEGDHFRVNGQKVWTSWAQYAQRCILLARTGSAEEAHRGITALFADMNSPGVTVRPLRAMNGDAEFAELFFDDVVVPKDRVIGTIGGGWAVTMYVLSCERGAVAWQRQAWMHRRLGDLLAAAGKGAGSTDGPASWAGETFANLYALRLASRRTFRRLDSGEIPGPDASIDKILMSTAEQGLFDGALEIVPEPLLAGDDSAARAWRSDYFYSRAASIYGGTSEIQRNIVAEHLLGLPRG
jgi:alkylation response protein AidB-like acyl-CoA dehydrogenase